MIVILVTTPPVNTAVAAAGSVPEIVTAGTVDP